MKQTIWMALIVVGAGLSVSAGESKGDAAKKELDKLQGKWRVVGSELNGAKRDAVVIKALAQSLTFKGDKFILTTFEGFSKAKGDFVDETPVRGTFTINAKAEPKEMDFAFEGGKKWKGIYRWDGDDLVVCSGSEKSDDRPKEFKTGTKGGGVQLQTFKK